MPFSGRCEVIEVDELSYPPNNILTRLSNSVTILWLAAFPLVHHFECTNDLK
jgi:hypothetical protein